jgi:hypothetical protein
MTKGKVREPQLEERINQRRKQARTKTSRMKSTGLDKTVLQ